MANDPELVSMLSQYRDSPAIFTIPTIPTDADFPFITANEDFTVTPFDTKTIEGRDISRYIRVYTEGSGSRILLDRISERVRKLFHRKHHEVKIEGFHVLLIDVQGPEFLAVPEQIYGTEFTIRFVMQDKNCCKKE